MSAERYVIDRQAVAAEIERRRGLHEKGYALWFARTLFIEMVAIYAIVYIARWTSDAPPIDALPRWRAFLFVGLPGVAALIGTWIGGRSLFGRDALDADHLAERVMQQIESLAGPGWVKRALLWGLLLGAGIGIPVGLLLAFTALPAAIPGGNRFLAVPLFFGMTLLWTIPMSFLFRWWSLISHRRFLRRVDSGE
jgi:hypothetical protein